MSKKSLALLLLPILFLFWLPGLVQAQEPDEEVVQIDWRELKTENFLIVYAESVDVDGEAVECICGLEPAEQYAAFVDDLYR